MKKIGPGAEMAKPAFDPAKEYRFVCTCCCQRIDPPLIYFCRDCWAEVPTQERVGLYNMHHRGQKTDSKVEKIVRILRKKKQPTKNENEINPHQGH